jgi:ubiquinone/menaquinone biosynthesis C-methylase UbiE/uncharacterized protein YbaR (Trm112 family)
MPGFAPGLHAAAGKVVDVAAYERFTGYWSRLFVPQVIAAAAIGPGSKVLDISTGTGEAALAILPAIGGSGLLVGADISPEMLDGARRRVRNHPGFWPVVADGQALPFQAGSFDAVVCQLGLQFFPDAARGLAEFQRVLRADGKASVCVISTADRAPIWGILAEAVARYLPEQRGVLMTSFSLSDAARLERLFAAAGFHDISVVRETRVGVVESLAAYWGAVEAGIGSIPQSYLLLAAADRRAVREEVDTRLAPYMRDGELHANIEMLIGSGHAGPMSESAGISPPDLPAAFDTRLAAMLICPISRGPLVYVAAMNELVSHDARLAYPVRDGVPVMLASAARRLE